MASQSIPYAPALHFVEHTSIAIEKYRSLDLGLHTPASIQISPQALAIWPGNVDLRLLGRMRVSGAVINA